MNKLTTIKKITKKVKGGIMTPQEQDDFNQMHQAALSAQNDTNNISQKLNQRDADLANTKNQLENERFQAERNHLITLALEREASVARNRANELYDKLAYDRINSHILNIVPLGDRFRVANIISDLARAKLIQGSPETTITNELIELVKTLTEEKVKKTSKKKTKKTSKKKTKKTSKKKSKKK